MDFEQHSSGVAKAGLATGITGTALGAVNLLSNGAGLLGGMARNNFGWGCGNNAWYNQQCGCGCGCSENQFVNRYEAGKDARIAELETAVALRDADSYTDGKMLEMYKYVDERLRGVESQLANQAVVNQRNTDSFQIVSERMDCCCKSMEEKIKAEKEARKCADNSIVNYVNATFYPKMVADVTTGSTTTQQRTYNPLPSCNPCYHA